jgi:hypothetical protein
MRDSASEIRLVWLPVADESAAACGIPADLLREHDAPLVLKMDNGVSFRSDELARTLSH